MSTPQTPTPQAGPELDGEVWRLLGKPKPAYEDTARLHWHSPPWGFRPETGWELYPPESISTDPGAAFRALEMWREQKAGRCWNFGSGWVREDATYGPDVELDEHEEDPPDVKTWRVEAPTFPLAAALALRSALGGGK